MLLRKGGIREASGRFSVVHDRVLLYPTYEHQQPHLLKAEYASRVGPVTSGWHPDSIRIGSWADVTDTIQVSNGDRVADLMPFHIWNETFIQDRLKWKPNQPLYILLLKVYKLDSPQWIPYYSTYGGCKSWIDLVDAIALEGTPVLSEPEYHRVTAAIHTTVTGSF